MQYLTTQVGIALVGAIVMATSCLTAAAAPPQTTEVARLSFGADSDQFGTSVSMQGGRILVGALQGDGVVANAGAAFVYERSGQTWNKVATLVASDGSEFVDFGMSVSLDQTRAAVGAEDASRSGLQFAGSAYVYDSTGGVWGQSARLTAQDAAPSDSFGSAISLLGGRVVVGARRDDYSGATDAGSAYVFDRNVSGSWNQTAKLTPADPQTDAMFGSSTAISTDRVVVGAPFFSTLNDFRLGATYVFDRQGGSWSQTIRLTPSDPAEEDRFGASVAIAGDRMLVGAPTASPASAQFAGAVYVFERLNGIWTETAKLTEPVPRPGDNFGFSVAIEGNRAIIGSPGLTVAAGSKGGAFVFDLVNGSWSNTAMLVASDATSNDAFGEAVSLFGNDVVVGARLADSPAGDNAGAAYVYSIPEPTSLVLAAVGILGLVALR